jgi:hypothetical protein
MRSHLHEATHRIAAGGEKKPNEKEKTPDRQVLSQ